MLLSDLKDVLFGSFDARLGSDDAVTSFATDVDSLAKKVARNLDQRESAVHELGAVDNTTIWDRLGIYWSRIDEELDPTSSPSRSEDAMIDLGTMFAKLERNLIAGLASHQEQAMGHEHKIRRVIFHITTFTRIEDPRFYRLQAMMTQLLSNMISPVSDESQNTDQVLAIYLSGKREDDVISRLLDSRDQGTNIATLHLLNNITRASPSRQSLLIDGVGLQWLSRLLSRMDEWLEAGDGRFEIACEIFTSYIQSGFQGRLVNALNLPTTSSEPITPAQTSLLKIVDSHLSAPHPNTANDAFLLPLFNRLHVYAAGSLSSRLDDARLPKVLEALVLVLEGLGSIGLACQGRRDRQEVGGEEEELVRQMQATNGIVGPIVDLLRKLNDFMPRLRPSPANPVSNEAPTERSLGGIKVSLIRLLGVLSYENTDVGDQVREHGGVQLVLSMTEVDELNPYLREHALFTIRNLMRNNPANQAVVKEMDPVGVVSETGEVLPLPEKMRRAQANKTSETG